MSAARDVAAAPPGSRQEANEPKQTLCRAPNFPIKTFLIKRWISAGAASVVASPAVTVTVTAVAFSQRAARARLNRKGVDVMTNKRPGIISVICVIGFIGALAAVPLIFSDISKQMGTWYPPYLAVSAVVGLVCMIGLWTMKKWSMIAYTAFFCINQGVLLALNAWNIFALIIPGIVIAIGFSKYKLMA